jgi:hypothetical protein
MKDDQLTPNDSNQENLRSLAQRFKYPPTPELSAKVHARLGSAPTARRPWKPLAVAVLLLLLLILFSVPVVRAKLSEFFQVGVVRIFPGSVTPTPLPTVIPTSLLDVAGKTTLEDARRKANFPLLLPSYPPDLGLPDLVYDQSSANMVILVWLEPADRSKVRLSLHEIAPGSFLLKKMSPNVIEETTVNGRYALWTTGPYMLEVQGDDYKMLRLVEGHALIWETGPVTYRLETSLPLEEAIKIAESLH